MERWRAGALAGVVLSVLLVLGAAQGLLGTERVLEADRLPELEAAGRLRGSLQALDLEGIAALTRAGATEAVLHDRELSGVSQRRAALLHELIGAAEHSALNEAQRGSFDTLEAGLGDYESQVQRARDLREHGSGAAGSALDAAEERMSGQLLPAATVLEQEASLEVDRAAQRERAPFRAAEGLAGLSTLLLTWWLVRVQVELSRRTQRRVHPFLLTATLLTLLAGVLLAGTLGRADRALARATGVDLASATRAFAIRNALLAALDEEGRARLGTHEAVALQARARSEADGVLVLPASLSVPQLLAALREGQAVDGFTGLLAQATGPDEPAPAREAGEQVLQTWDAVQSGARAAREATPPVSPLRSTRQGDLEAALDALGSAAVRDVRQDLRTSAEEARHAGWGAAAVGLAAWALLWSGFGPRLREYRGH